MAFRNVLTVAKNIGFRSLRRVRFSKTWQELNTKPAENIVDNTLGIGNVWIRRPTTRLKPRMRELFDQDFQGNAILKTHRGFGPDDIHQPTDGASFFGHADE